MENMTIYESARTCPDNALRAITAGRLKGKSDINPMWRLKKLTELFGACGVGWYYDIDRQWTEQGANGEVTAFCNISLYIKADGEWSKPIKGTGGSMMVANERNGAYTSDECYKMALTDAISVACKALGFAADVYWNADRTKYDQTKPQPQNQPQQPPQNQRPTQPQKISNATVQSIEGLIQQTNSDREKFLRFFNVSRIEEMDTEQAKKAMAMLKGKLK